MNHVRKIQFTHRAHEKKTPIFDTLKKTKKASCAKSYLLNASKNVGKLEKHAELT